MALGRLSRTWVLVLAGIAGCITPSDLLEGQRCPCVTGWVCDEGRDLCVQVVDGGVDPTDGGPVDSSIDSDELPDAPDLSDALIDDGGPDASVTPPAPVSTACWRSVMGCDWSDPSARFVESSVAGVDAFGTVSNPTLSPDGCTLYYPVDGDVVEVRRSDALSAFGTPVFTTTINSRTSREDKATITPDGLELLFTSDRDSMRTVMWRSRRELPDVAWGAPVQADELNLAGFSLFDPSLAPHGLRFYYAPSAANQRLYVAERSDLAAPFNAPRPLNEAALDLPGIALAEPTVNHQETVLVFVGADGDNVYRTYVSERDDWTQEFGPARVVPSAFASSNEINDVALSPDGCELFVRPRTGGFVQLVYESD